MPAGGAVHTRGAARWISGKETGSGVLAGLVGFLRAPVVRRLCLAPLAPISLWVPTSETWLPRRLCRAPGQSGARTGTVSRTVPDLAAPTAGRQLGGLYVRVAARAGVLSCVLASVHASVRACVLASARACWRPSVRAGVRAHPRTCVVASVCACRRPSVLAGARPCVLASAHIRVRACWRPSARACVCARWRVPGCAECTVSQAAPSGAASAGARRKRAQWGGLLGSAPIPMLGTGTGRPVSLAASPRLALTRGARPPDCLASLPS